ncbi:MAG: MgtC/SapB family protein [Candidatus Woesearchaeota archaeon]
MLQNILTGHEGIFLINLLICMVCGLLIGMEREARGKDAGIGTHTLVITGSMIFTFISQLVDPTSTSRIAAQVITGIGFLGAGMILRSEESRVRNLTTAASIWYSGAIGMLIGFNFQIIAILAVLAGILILLIPHPKIKQITKKDGSMVFEIDEFKKL